MKQLVLAFLLAAGLSSCTNYGDKVSKDYLDVYYKDGATKEEAQKTLNVLYDAWKTDGDKTEKKSVQLTKSGDSINFRMVVDKSKLEKVTDDNMFLMSHYLSDSVYGGAPVNIVLADNKFATIRTIAYRKMTLADEYGGPETAGKIEVYSRGGFSSESAKQIADYIQTQLGNPDAVTSFVVSQSAEAYEVSMLAKKDKLNMDEAALNKLATGISQNIFNGGPVLFEVIDEDFKTYKTMPIVTTKPLIDTFAVTH